MSPSLKSLAAIRPVNPWAFLFPHWPKLLNCWELAAELDDVVGLWALEGLGPPESKFPTWFTWAEGLAECWLWLELGAVINWVNPFSAAETLQQTYPEAGPPQVGGLTPSGPKWACCLWKKNHIHNYYMIDGDQKKNWLQFTTFFSELNSLFSGQTLCKNFR